MFGSDLPTGVAAAAAAARRGRGRRRGRRRREVSEGAGAGSGGRQVRALYRDRIPTLTSAAARAPPPPPPSAPQKPIRHRAGRGRERERAADERRSGATPPPLWSIVAGEGGVGALIVPPAPRLQIRRTNAPRMTPCIGRPNGRALLLFLIRRRADSRVIKNLRLIYRCLGGGV